MKIITLTFTILTLATVFLFTGCSDNNITGDDQHHDEYAVEFSYTPDPATVNTEISFTFKVEDEHGEHVEGLMQTECDFEMEGIDPVEIELTEDSSDHGHYMGTATFTMAGEYEVHFHYMHDDESNHISADTTFTVQ